MMPPVFDLPPASSAVTATAVNEPPALGEIIAEGYFGVVHADRHNVNKVIKTLKSKDQSVWPDAEEECQLFKRYYGDTAAELMQHDGKYYLRMDRLPGLPLHQVTLFHAGAERFFFDMLREMESKHIYHADLKMDNVLYCAERNRFYPVDITNSFEQRRCARKEDHAVIHDEYIFKANAIANLIMNGSVQVQQIDTPPPLGTEIGRGDHGRVYLDTEDSRYVWKQFSGTYECDELTAQMETCAFNRYYGCHAAEVLTHAGTIYIKMLRVPGIPLKDVRMGDMHENALSAFHNMLSAMAAAKIMHGDLYENNIHYDCETNHFYPIDIQNHYYDYFMENNVMKNIYNIAHLQMSEHLTYEILSRMTSHARIDSNR